MRQHPDELATQNASSTSAVICSLSLNRISRLKGYAIPLLWGAAVVTVLANKAAEMYQIPSRDSGVFASIGLGILRGQVPYRDLWDHKPPAIYYTDALVFSFLPASSVSLHLFEAFYALLTLPVFYWCARAFFGKAGAALATFFFGMFSTLPLLNEGGNFTETYLMLPLVALYGCAARYFQRRNALWLVAAGAFGGVAFLYNPKAALAPTVFALVLLGMAWRQGGAALRVLASYAALLLGWLGVITPVLLYFWGRGALGEMVEQTLLFNAHYIAIINLSDFFVRLLASMIHLLRGMAVLWLLAVLGLFALARYPREHPRLLLVLAWLAAESYGALLGGRFYLHYFLLLVPPLALLGTYGLLILLTEVREQPFFAMRDGRAAVLFVLVAAFTLLPFLGQIGAGVQSLLAGSGTEDTPQERVAALVREETRPGEAIFVWGAEATVYFLAGRPSPARFLYNYPLIPSVAGQPTGSNDRAALLQEFMGDLAQDPPRFIAIPPAHQDLSVLPPLDDWIGARYTLYRTIEGWHVYRGMEQYRDTP